MSPNEAPDHSVATSQAGAGHDPCAVLCNRDYVLYLVGRAIAVFGQQIPVLAVGWDWPEIRRYGRLDV